MIVDAASVADHIAALVAQTSEDLPVADVLFPGEAGRFDLDDDTQRVIVMDDGSRYVLTVAPAGEVG